MVRMSFFGDDRDYFKYDLITHILSANILNNYSFVPMLTKHIDDNLGNIKPLKSACKSQELLSFINNLGSRDLNHWEKWMGSNVVKYNVMQPVHDLFFNHSDRSDYWVSHVEVIRTNNSLVFFDPDTGLQAGLKTRIKKDDKEKYILDNDLGYLIENMADSSVFMFYQHLQRNSKKHEGDVNRKLSAISEICGPIHACAYREKDLAFVFVVKDELVYERIMSTLEQYHSKSSIVPRGVHPTGKSGLLE